MVEGIAEIVRFAALLPTLVSCLRFPAANFLPQSSDPFQEEGWRFHKLSAG